MQPAPETRSDQVTSGFGTCLLAEIRAHSLLSKFYTEFKKHQFLSSIVAIL